MFSSVALTQVFQTLTSSMVSTVVSTVVSPVVSALTDTVGEVCPWSGYDPGTVHFCEARLCAWVVEPSNAWSSLGYIVLGLMMFVLARRRRDGAIYWAVAAAQFMIGVGSFFFHGTGIFIGEVIDQIGMFQLSVLILACAAAQAWNWSGKKTVAVYAVGVVVSTLAILVVRPLGIPIFAAQLAAGLLWQLRLSLKAHGEERALGRIFAGGVVLFLCSFGIWLTDMTGLICDPDNHLITGHAIWHILNAICIWRLGTFYRARLPS